MCGSRSHELELSESFAKLVDLPRPNTLEEGERWLRAHIIGETGC